GGVRGRGWWWGRGGGSTARARLRGAPAAAAIASGARPSEKLGPDSSGSPALLYEPMKAYYDARAREYDDWIRGVGIYADRDRPGWSEELAALEQSLRSLRPQRALHGAPGSGQLPPVA